MRRFLNYVPVACLLIALGYWVYCCCHGFDMSDEGFLMTLYRDFSEGERNITSAAGYPLTCWLGGKLLSLCPDNLLSFRLVGVAMYLVMGVIVYSFLCKSFSRPVVSLGLLTLSFIFACDPKPFGYNGLTAFFAVIATVLIVQGLTCGKSSYLITGGSVLGFNVFVRLPNIVLFGLAILPFFTLEHFTVQNVCKEAKRSAWILFGVVLGFLVGAVLMRAIGCWGLVVGFVQSIGELTGGDSSHGLSSMLNNIVQNYAGSCIYFFLFCALIQLFSIAIEISPIFIFLVVLIITVFIRIFVQSDTFLGKDMLSLLNAISLFGTVRYLFCDAKKRIVAGSALLLAVLMPLGSDLGFVTFWCGPILAYPIGLCGLLDIASKVRISISYGAHTSAPEPKAVLCGYQSLFVATALCMVVFCLCVGVKGWRKAYFDPGSRHVKVCVINSARASGIKTTKRNGHRVNPLFSELRWYVRTGDTVLAYDWAPMLYYLLGLRAYGGVAWPCVLYGEPYVRTLELERSRNAELPVIVLQHYRAIDAEINLHYYDESYASDESQRKMISAINAFIEQNHYRKVWSNGWYDIYLPPGRDRFETPCFDWWDKD